MLADALNVVAEGSSCTLSARVDHAPPPPAKADESVESLRKLFDDESVPVSADVEMDAGVVEIAGDEDEELSATEMAVCGSLTHVKP